MQNHISDAYQENILSLCFCHHWVDSVKFHLTNFQAKRKACCHGTFDYSMKLFGLHIIDEETF